MKTGTLSQATLTTAEQTRYDQHKQPQNCDPPLSEELESQSDAQFGCDLCCHPDDPAYHLHFHNGSKPQQIHGIDPDENLRH
ncbi:ST-I family heat-stable enterotoxin [Paenibacillus graminis]|uniref:ST-I family heat-stable enterotoxin n=1 Tax=Paenibacillus graminis TaxID=189425 RepID=UPI00398B90F8